MSPWTTGGSSPCRYTRPSAIWAVYEYWYEYVYAEEQTRTCFNLVSKSNGFFCAYVMISPLNIQGEIIQKLGVNSSVLTPRKGSMFGWLSCLHKRTSLLSAWMVDRQFIPDGAVPRNTLSVGFPFATLLESIAKPSSRRAVYPNAQSKHPTAKNMNNWWGIF